MRVTPWPSREWLILVRQLNPRDDPFAEDDLFADDRTFIEDDAWSEFHSRLFDVEEALKTYRGVFRPPYFYRWGLGDKLDLKEIERLLSFGLEPPHGLDLLMQPELPELPEKPSSTPKRLYKDTLSRRERLSSLRKRILSRRERDETRCEQLHARCRSGDPAAIHDLLSLTFTRHRLPKPLPPSVTFALDFETKIALCTIEAPDFARLSIVRRSRNWEWIPVSKAEKKRSSERLLYSLCIRAAYLTAMSDPGEFFDTIAVNARQKWFDPATGNPREGITASLQATKDALTALRSGHLEPKACFRHLAGIATPNPQDAAPIRPIFFLDMADRRIAANRDVAADLGEETNLASMPWEDFEHLVRQLFEWMFEHDGVEVKVTRASRDRGVDAIIFDPDPIRGGKYVVQAKRYTRTVDVAAVRDLYGTVVNEGANRGILVTTASFGPDAYEFAKNKPISLIDGPNLIALLLKYGRKYRINLEEARCAK